MQAARENMKALVFWVVVIGALIWWDHSQSSTPSSASPRVSNSTDSDASYSSKSYDRSVDSSSSDSRTFDGYTCTVDCSGHEAGYQWAEEHDIDDEEACDTAADHSNSPSFGEGCKAYVNGDSEDEDSDNSDDQ